MGAFRILNNDKLKDKIFIGFNKGKYVELFMYGRRLKVNINDVEVVDIV